MTTQEINTLPATTTRQLYGLVDQSLGDVFPALTLAIIHRGEWVMSAAWGWGDPETQQYPVTPDTVFDLASVTKLFTATAFLSLVSEGRVDLGDPVVSVVPEFGHSGPRPVDGGQDPLTKEMLPTPASVRGQLVDPSRVTFWHLLTHTSGLAPWRHVYQDAGPPPTPPHIPDPVSRDERWRAGLAAICAYPFVGQPGEVVRYSDLGIMVLGEAASRLHGTPGRLDDTIQHRVLDALDLTTMAFNPVRNGRDRSVIAPTEEDRSWRNRRCWGEVHDENAAGVGGVAGHAGLFGSAVDVARFGQAWLASDDRLAIAPELMADARREHAATGGMRYGLGWRLSAYEDSPAGDVFSLDAYGHTGFTGTSLWIDPQRDLIVACLTNRVYSGRDKPGIHRFRRAVHDIIATGIDALG